jgi:hypothetical protein
MTIRSRDLLATGLVIALVTLYLSHAAGAVVQDVRAMTSLALMLGGAIVAILLPAENDDATGWFAVAVAVVGVGFGVAALALTAGSSEIMLAAFVGSVLLIWGFEVAEHITFPPPKQ